ncbi:porin [Salibaculum griseiflavum]|uniref:Porin domain-containing protein n=1 Tax=Salibaculum griseiflavum TaxID=1914409 RepID=A0A2V1P145_9RHOB|nr:porin [Salibaculum griseiflavum]PWG16259.1 hypothetical protein DFK10_12240 [Salibaculum griseiflavum]
MKSILLASASVFAFAGAAAAEVSFSGTASAEYNSLDGYATDTDLTVTLTQELDNGLTASASLSFEDDDMSDDIEGLTYGDISLTSDNAGITFGTDLAGAAYSAVSDTIGIGQGEDGLAGITGYYSIDATTIFVSMPIAEGDTSVDSDDIEFGVTSDLGGWEVGFGYDKDATDTNFVVKGSGNAAGLDITVAAGNIAGASRWDVAVAYPVGPVTLGATVDDSEAWEVTFAYAEGPLTVDAAFDSTDDYSLEGSYDVGNGLVVYAGLEDAGNDYYLGGAYDLGGGASFTASFVEDGGTANADNEIGAQDYADGTTVGVSFEF